MNEEKPRYWHTKKPGLSDYRLGQLCGLSATSLRDYRRGRCKPRDEKVREFLKDWYSVGTRWYKKS